MKAPVIFLAFANDNDDHLATLEEESRRLELMLTDWHQKGLVELYIVRKASLQDIYNAITRFKDRLAIFHYAGHANGAQLCLDDEAVNAVGIAQLLQSQAKAQLKLVFLNGCSTYDQVEKLHQFGVSAVIATSVPIQDTKAMVFAMWFYQSLCGLYSIKESFNNTAALMKAHPTFHQELGYEATVQRGLKTREEKAAGFAWGLYIHSEVAEAFDWKLPQFKVVTGPTPGPGGGGRYVPNQAVPEVLDAMLVHKPSIKREMFTPDEEEIDRSDYPDLIIKHFPMPLGIQIQKLVSNEEGDDMQRATLVRLKQMASTYTVATQLPVFILLSQLWEEYRTKPIQVDIGQVLKQLLDKQEDNAAEFNYFEALEKLAKTFKQNFLKPFVKEFSENAHETPLFARVNNPDDSFFKAGKGLEALKKAIASQEISEADYESLCISGEKNLVEVLKGLAFLAKYVMLTVRDIELFRPRFYEMQFQHRYANLNLSTDSSIKIKEKRITSPKSVDSGSVVLVEKTTSLTYYLNLSPFIIDRYAFDPRSDSHIYLYAYRSGEEYVFFRSTSEIYKAQAEPDDHLDTSASQKEINPVFVELIKKQFNMLRQDLISPQN